MTFEALRAQFSHSLLENLVFSYLAGPFSAWRDTAGSDTDRAGVAASNWEIAAKEHPEGLRRVVQIWKEYKGKGVTTLAAELYRQARNRTPYRTTVKFPSWDEMSSLLEEMSVFMLLVESDGYTYVVGREDDAYRFWLAALKFHRIVQGLRFGSTEFWEWYEELP